MALYFFMLIAFASMRFFRKHFTHPHIDAVASATRRGVRPDPGGGLLGDPRRSSLRDIAMDIAYAVAVVWVSHADRLLLPGPGA